jgi:hypothetical protein
LELDVVARRVLIALVLVGIIAPTIVVVLVAVAKLLASMGDATGAVCVERLALAIGIFWLIDLILLLMALGVGAVDRWE